MSCHQNTREDQFLKDKSHFQQAAENSLKAVSEMLDYATLLQSDAQSDHGD